MFTISAHHLILGMVPPKERIRLSDWLIKNPPPEDGYKVIDQAILHEVFPEFVPLKPKE
jgi:hypothetical protein